MYRGASMQGVLVRGSVWSLLCISNHWAVRVEDMGQHWEVGWDR
jgi:hypothetical protein